jgi:hypothetical protein
MAFEDVLAVVGTIGGLGAFAGAVGGLVGKYMSDRAIQSHKATLDKQLESHKAELGLQLESYKGELAQDADRNRLLLKRQELMFEREFEAVVAFLKLHNKVVPEPWAPDPDWYDAQERIAENLSTHDGELKKLLDRHSVALSKEARQLISSAKSKANEGLFEVALETTEGQYEQDSGPSDKVRKIVDEFYERMKLAEAQVRLDLKVGSFDD